MKTSDKLKDGAVVVLFSSDTCHPCKVMKQNLDNLIPLYNGRYCANVHYAILYAENHKDIFDEYAVRGVPQVLMMIDGEVIHHIDGKPNTLLLEARLIDFYRKVQGATHDE